MAYRPVYSSDSLSKPGPLFPLTYLKIRTQVPSSNYFSKSFLIYNEYK